MDQEVKALRSELALLKHQFDKRIDAVEARLNSLQPHEQQSVVQIEASDSEKTKRVAIDVQNTVQDKDKEASRSYSIEPHLTVKTHTSLPTKPSLIELLLRTILASLFEWFSPVINVFQSYKERGMLGIFILTIVGIALTLAGFGYLMQLMIDELEAGAKSLLMCSASVFVIGVGIGIKNKTRFVEFATAIITLGVLLSYSTIYFTGSVYGLIPSPATVFLYLLVAIACHLLAIWLETKVVAGLGIVGIATMPILSNTIQVEPFYYLLSLAFVTVSSLVLAHRKKEPWLANLSLVFCVVALEWTIGIEALDVPVWIIAVFYFLFFTYIALNLFKSMTSNQTALILLVTLIGSNVLFLFQAHSLFSFQVSVSLALNFVVAAFVGTLFYKVKHTCAHFLVLITALWGVLFVVSVISEAFWGIAWALEGLLLLQISRKYQIVSTANHGQILTGLALIYSLSALAMYFPLPALKSINGWILSIVILAVIGIWHRMMNNTNVFDEFSVTKVKPFLKLLEMIWFATLVIASLHIWLGNWTGCLIILLQLVLLFRAKQCKQTSIEIFAATLILVPIYFAYNGALIVDSYRFTSLPLFAQISIASAFCQLWLWSEFYRRYLPDSVIVNVTESARILFYMLLPVCWVGSLIRRFDENSLMLLWLSPLIALFLAQKIKHRLLVIETKLLTVVMSLAFVCIVGLMKPFYSLFTLLGFMSFYFSAYYLDQKVTKSILCKFISHCGVISLGFALPSILGLHSESLLIGLVSASLYWSLLLSMLNRFEFMRKSERFVILINTLLIVSAWWLTFEDAWFVVLPLIFLVAAISQRKTFFGDNSLGKICGEYSVLFLHTLAVITYTTFLASLIEYRLDLFISPVLAVHGAFILFLKDKRIFTVKYSFCLIGLGILKLALIDAANALLWQKVILFMGIGIFILVASFWYQKLTKKTEQKFI